MQIGLVIGKYLWINNNIVDHDDINNSQELLILYMNDPISKALTSKITKSYSIRGISPMEKIFPIGTYHFTLGMQSIHITKTKKTFNYAFSYYDANLEKLEIFVLSRNPEIAFNLNVIIKKIDLLFPYLVCFYMILLGFILFINRDYVDIEHKKLLLSIYH